MAGVCTIPFNGPYNASKHAVVALTETIAAEMEELGLPIGATVLCTGLVDTGIRNSAGLRPDSSAEDETTLPSASAPAEAAGKPIGAEAVAGMVMDAIEANQLHLFTNPGSAERIRTRVDKLLADL
jgi:NAD(P)-dependent dehydrogenase (short-subunit alcohol dehydrogenase family)